MTSPSMPMNQPFPLLPLSVDPVPGDPMSAASKSALSFDTGRVAVSARPARSTHVWLVTFSDLVLLLLTFFVLLFAMSDIDLGRYGALSRSTGQAIADPNLIDAPAPTSDFAIQQRELIPAEDLGFLKAIITDALAKDARFGQVATRLTGEYLVLSLPGSLLFTPGSAIMTPQAEAAVFDLAGLLGALDNAIAVSGHVGPAVLGDEPFLSAWELSLVRALTVSDSLRKSGFAGPLTVLGRADIDYRTRSQNLPELAKAVLAAAADRVDIVIFPHMSGV